MRAIAVDPSMRASTAAIAAEQLMLHVVEQVTSTIAFTPKLWQFLDDLHACTKAVSRLALSQASHAGVTDETWDIALTTLARMNVRYWLHTSGPSFGEQYCLIDTVERVFVDRLACRFEHHEQRRIPVVEAVPMTELIEAANELMDAAQAATDHYAAVSVHVLIAVALRAMNER